MKNTIQLILVLMLVTLPFSVIYGQESERYHGDYADFYRAERLFEKEQYSAARKVFTTFIQEFNYPQDPQYIKALYYRGLSALELYNSDAVQLLLTFINEYPESIYINTIYFKLGTQFYQRKKYKKSRKWLKKTDILKLDSFNLAAYHFKLGYANFQLGDFTKARNEFYEIKDDSSNYSAPALYYYSYIEYQNKAFKTALDGFLKLHDNPTFKKEVEKYIVQLYYLLGNYEKITEYADNFSSKDGIEGNTPEMNHLIGEAYYKIKKYDEAVAYLANYASRRKTTRNDDYALGYSYFKIGQYEEAVNWFNRVAIDKDTLSQIAYYHIAEAYLKEEKLNYARSAFHSAAEITINKVIQEDALYRYAVLSYKLDYNPYNNAIKAFEQFLKTFPHSDRKEDVYNYLVNVYTSTKNYKAALSSLDNIPDKNIELKTVYQVVSFNKGVEEYEKGKYQKAITTLKGVYRYNVDPSIAGRATFWTADAYYNLTQWDKAIDQYRAFLKIPGVNKKSLIESAYYNIGYAYFMQKDWSKAIVAFRDFTQLNAIQNTQKLADAYIRLGDCYYTKAQPNFERSAENYRLALKYGTKEEDKVLNSLARVYKLMPGQREKEIAVLNQLLDQSPHSSYTVQALMALGEAYKNNRDYSKALMSYKKIVNKFPQNAKVKDALIGIGSVYFKQDKYTLAEDYFKRVLNDYSLSNEKCKRVTQTLVDIYRVTRHQEKIASLGKKYACAGITEKDQEVFYYETASELYAAEKYDEAIPELEKYLKHYPNGQFTTQLTAYLGNIYYKKGNLEKALGYYKKVIERPTSSYMEQALVRTSKVLYNDKKYVEALPYYQKLEKLTADPNTLFNTEVGLMRCNYLLGNYVNATRSAKKVLENDLLKKESIKSEAHYIKGMSDFKNGDYKNALTALRWTADHTKKERGTEALFTLTKAQFKLGNYEKAETLHNELMKRKPSYDYWIAKSLILQAKVFIQKDNLFQAKQTVNLVINNYPNDNDDIISTAMQVRKKIKQLENPIQQMEVDSNRTINLNDEEKNK